MGPERKNSLLATDSLERMRQETEQILATSRRLLEEMQVLLERANQLAEQHETLLGEIHEQRRRDSKPRGDG